MTTLDNQIRELLEDGDHEDWCDARTHADCCDKGCNCFLGPANAAIVAVLDTCDRVENGAMDGGWNLVGHAFAEEFRSAIASALGITQEATDGEGT